MFARLAAGPPAAAYGRENSSGTFVSSVDTVQINPEIHVSGASSPLQNFGGFPDCAPKGTMEARLQWRVSLLWCYWLYRFHRAFECPITQEIRDSYLQVDAEEPCHTDELPVIHVHFGDEFICSVEYPFQPNVFQLLPWWLIWLVLTRKRVQALVTWLIVSRSCQIPHHLGANPSWGWTVWDFSIFRVCEFLPAAVVGTDCNNAFTAFEACMAAFWAVAPSSLWFAGTPVALPSRSEVHKSED